MVLTVQHFDSDTLQQIERRIEQWGCCDNRLCKAFIKDLCFID